MVQFIADLLGITDERYYQYIIYGALIMLPLITMLLWDAMLCLFKSFTRFR